MENARKIATNTFSQVGAKFVIAALQVLIFRAITGYLGRAGYGQYTAVYEFAGLFTIAADFGLFTIGVARIAGKSKEAAEKILASIFTLRLVLVAVVTLAATGAAFLMPSYSPEMRWGVLLAALANGTYLVMLTLSSVLQVQLRMTRNAIDQVLGRVVMLVAVYAITIAWTGDRALGLLLLFSAGLLGNLVSTVLTARAIRHDAHIRLSFDGALWRDLLGSSLPYGLSLILGVVYLRIGTPLLSHLADDADVGLYGLGLKLYDLLVVFPFAFMNSVLPALARNLQNRARLEQLTQYALEFLATIGFGALAGMLILAEPVVHFLAAGQDFRGAETNVRVMMVAMLLNFFTSLFSYLLLALRREKLLLGVNALAAVVSVLVNIWFITTFTQKSLATATAILIPQTLVLAIIATIALRQLKIRLSLLNPLKAFAAAAGMAGVLWLVDRGLAGAGTAARILVEVPVGGITYALLLLIFGAVHADALDALLARRRPKPGDPLVIGMDLRSFHSAKTGKEWYTISLLNALMDVDRTNRYILYTKYPIHIPDLPANFEIRVLRVPILFWHLAVLRDLWRSGVQVWIATASYIIPALLFTRWPRCILVVHDLVAFLKTNRHLKKAVWIERVTLRLALRHSDQVVAVSRTTSEDLRRVFPWAAERVHVIPEAARASFHPVDRATVHAMQERYGLPRQYLIFVGTLEPRKNLPRLIRAYAALDPALRASTPLALVGKKGWYYDEIFHTVQELGLEEQVRFLGYVPDEDLPALLTGATVFILPSLYEGFGLPLLEAFACGTPVISSNTPALVEVAGEGCVTVDPLKVEDMTRTIREVLTNADLRAGMRAWGEERTQAFSWANTAKRVHALLINAVANGTAAEQRQTPPTPDPGLGERAELA